MICYATQHFFTQACMLYSSILLTLHILYMYICNNIFTMFCNVDYIWQTWYFMKMPPILCFHPLIISVQRDLTWFQIWCVHALTYCKKIISCKHPTCRVLKLILYLNKKLSTDLIMSLFEFIEAQFWFGLQVYYLPWHKLHTKCPAMVSLWE